METVINILSKKFSQAFLSSGYKKELGVVQLSDRPDLCQFQCNGAFAAAKEYKKSPKIIGEEIISFLEKDDLIESISLVGAGFINFGINDSFLINYCNEIFIDENYGINQNSDETIFLDYGGPNVAKPLHIGHLRSAVIGESLKRIAKSTGRITISDVHLGDWGLQIGLVIAELEERFGENFEDISLTEDELNSIYPYASNKSKSDLEFKDKAKNVTALLQNYHPKYIEIWKKIMAISLAGIKESYKQLNVSFDLWYGESDAEKYVSALITLLQEKDLLIESMGAMVVNVSEADDNTDIPPVIIKKSDNSNIYATTDLATIIQRKNEYNPSEIWYIVDNRQSMHFTQVFRCACKADIVQNENTLMHLGFGTMNGTDGKPYKTRDGGVMRLSDFYNLVYDNVYRKVEKSKFSIALNKQEVAQKITVATIKFGDLINHRTKDYIFDLEKFTASEGKTGSFLLYTIARINSILSKFDNQEFVIEDHHTVYTISERNLLLKLALSNEVVLNAYKDKAPNYICEDAYQISSAFSKFYYENHIVNENDSSKKSAWLNICKLTKHILTHYLYLLGIETVELM